MAKDQPLSQAQRDKYAQQLGHFQGLLDDAFLQELLNVTGPHEGLLAPEGTPKRAQQLDSARQVIMRRFPDVNTLTHATYGTWSGALNAGGRDAVLNRAAAILDIGDIRQYLSTKTVQAIQAL